MFTKPPLKLALDCSPSGILLQIFLCYRPRDILNLSDNFKVKKARVPFFVKPITKAVADKVLSEFVNPNIKRLLDFIETSLEGKKWFLGDQLSGADIQMSFPLETSVAQGLIDDHYPCIHSYVERIHQQTSYQAALKKGGKYDYA